MLSQGQLIICRRCSETVPLEEESCPHCGTSIRGNLAYIAAIILGFAFLGTSLLNPGRLLVFGLLGLLIGVGAGYLFYNKRQRISEASTETENTI